MPSKVREKPSTPSASEVVKKRAKKAEFDTVPMTVSGMRMRHEKDNVPNITKKTAGHLAMEATVYVDLKDLKDRVAEQQKDPETFLKQAATDHRGFRGIESDEDNFSLAVNPRHTIKWNEDQLRQDLGANYSSIVHEQLGATVAVPLGYETDEGPLTSELLSTALRRGLATLGLSKQDIESMVSTDVGLSVDEAELARQLEAGKVSLSDGAAEVTETWSITVNPLNKNT